VPQEGPASLLESVSRGVVCPARSFGIGSTDSRVGEQTGEEAQQPCKEVDTRGREGAYPLIPTYLLTWYGRCTRCCACQESLPTV